MFVPPCVSLSKLLIVIPTVMLSYACCVIHNKFPVTQDLLSNFIFSTQGTMTEPVAFVVKYGISRKLI